MRGEASLFVMVMLLAFAIGIATIISVWFGGVIDRTTDSTTNKTSATISCASGAVSIDQVYVLNSTTARAVVRNKGFLSLNVVSAQMFNTTGNNFSASGIPVTLQKGEIRSIDFVTNFASCPASFSKLLVSTNCGGVEAAYEGSPRCL